MLYGYCRVSRTDQDTALQRAAIESAGCDVVFEEKRSARKRRPQRDALVQRLRPGDVVVVWKLDRFARSVVDLYRGLEAIGSAGASLRVLTQPVDTGTPIGRLMLSVLGAVAEFELELIRERSMAGQAAAWARGARRGRPRSMSAATEAALVRAVRAGARLSDAAQRYGVHVSSAKRAVLRVR